MGSALGVCFVTPLNRLNFSTAFVISYQLIVICGSVKQTSEISGQTSEIRGQKSDVTSQMSDVGGHC